MRPTNALLAILGRVGWFAFEWSSHRFIPFGVCMRFVRLLRMAKQRPQQPFNTRRAAQTRRKSTIHQNIFPQPRHATRRVACSILVIGCTSRDASAGNRTRVTSMATMYSTTRPLMLVGGACRRHAAMTVILISSISVAYKLASQRLQCLSDAPSVNRCDPAATASSRAGSITGICVRREVLRVQPLRVSDTWRCVKGDSMPTMLSLCNMGT